MKNEYLKYRQKWALADEISLYAPLHLDIEINTTCNHRCMSCWHSEQPVKAFMSGGMDHDLVISLLAQGERAGVPAVKFNFRGEPTLHKRLIQYAEYAKNHGYIDRLINTNGSFSLDMADQLNRYFNTIILSLDSVETKTYSKLHGVKDTEYYTLRENIEHFAQLRRAGVLNAKIILNYHRNLINKDECLHEFIKSYPSFPIREKFTQPREGQDISLLRPEEPRELPNFCYHANRRLTILTNGRVYPCCMSYNEPDDIYLGNANKLRLMTIWRGKNRMDLLKKFKTGFLPETCKKCTSNMRVE